MYNCDICGRPIAPHTTIFQGNLAICAECLSQNGLCFSCACQIQCAFHNYTGPLPKTIIKISQIPRIGRAQIQVPNPEVEKITCHTCECWNTTEKVCNKEQFHTCGNHTYSI